MNEPDFDWNDLYPEVQRFIEAQEKRIRGLERKLAGELERLVAEHKQRQARQLEAQAKDIEKLRYRVWRVLNDIETNEPIDIKEELKGILES